MMIKREIPYGDDETSSVTLNGHAFLSIAIGSRLQSYGFGGVWLWGFYLGCTTVGKFSRKK